MCALFRKCMVAYTWIGVYLSHKQLWGTKESVRLRRSIPTAFGDSSFPLSITALSIQTGSSGLWHQYFWAFHYGATERWCSKNHGHAKMEGLRGENRAQRVGRPFGWPYGCLDLGGSQFFPGILPRKLWRGTWAEAWLSIFMFGMRAGTQSLGMHNPEGGGLWLVFAFWSVW